MTHLNSESGDYLLQSNSSDDDNGNDNDDDLVTFQFNSSTINFYYSQLSKYSKLVRDKYLFTDIVKRFPSEICSFQQQCNIISENIILFFQLLQQNFDFDENIILTYKQCIDLFKISEYLEINKLSKRIKKYIKMQKNDNVNFTIQIILHEVEVQDNSKGYTFKIKQQMEDLLATKIDESLKNKNFADLPISVIFRIVEKSSKKKFPCDALYDMIKKSISKFCILFQFLDLQNLSDDRLCDLCESFSSADEKGKSEFSYLKCNLMLVKKLNEERKSLRMSLEQSEIEKKQLKSDLNELKSQKIQVEKEKDSMKQKLESDLNELKSQKIQVEKEKDSMKQKLESDLNELKSQKIQIEKEKDSMKQQIEDLAKEKNRLEKQIEDEKYKIAGEIEASVKNGLIFNAKISLKEGNTQLDKSRSKYIVSTSNEDELGSEAYAEGEPITSLNLTTVDFAGKSGTYYVRALVVGTNGRAKELVSNPVTTSGACVSFGYEGRAKSFVLAKGRYKLEVWGAEGGKSTGNRQSGSPGIGGLGGYSTGSISLVDQKKIFVYVGGEGRSAESGNGCTTDGAFPDGGGTKTGHKSGYTSVPGTGGGSTSIRVSSDSLYSRVIVAGGGGGASGDSNRTNNGGFGGGLCGGNCHYVDSLQSQGAGTQTGSSPGLGNGSNGVAGQFGQGATGLYKSGSNSGGGGGGGWYGGGSGGYGGVTNCSSGGGGSGWVFTESNFNNWKSGDQTKADNFTLDKSYYLSNASTFTGDSSFPNSKGNGNETGHHANGFAKITPQ